MSPGFSQIKWRHREENMRISQLFQERKVVYSFEIFPPKKDAPISVVYDTLAELHMLEPAYISVTYGAGGSGSSNKTGELASFITTQYGIPSIAHLTCVHASRQEIEASLTDLKTRGVENILALRGDRVPGLDKRGEFTYASQLISFIRERGDFTIGAACYPEGHSESTDLESDLIHLKEKVDCGVSFLTTQLFFDNDDFYAFRERAEKIGITVPISAGIMPVTSIKQIQRIVSLSGSKIPGRLAKIIARYEDDPVSFRQAGLEYAQGQILHLLKNETRGIHLYTMNNPEVSRQISAVVRPVVDAINGESKK